MDPVDPYIPPSHVVSPIDTSRPVFCWVVLGIALLQWIGLGRAFFGTPASPATVLSWFMAEPKLWLGLLLPVTYTVGAVMYFRMRWQSLVVLFIWFLISEPRSFHSWETGASSTFLFLLNLVFQVFTLAYGLHLLRVGRFR